MPTRWNSTFLIIKSTLYYRQAFLRLKLSDSSYKHYPSDDERGRAEEICKFLEIFL